MKMKNHNFTELLKEKGLKATLPRVAVLEGLSRLKKPVSAQKLHESLKGEFDLATVYRNLEILAEKGLVFEEVQKKETKYYFDKKQHHHVMCRECGYSECLPCNHSFSTVRSFKKVSHKILLEGVCAKCLI